jgi:hypothetical protein
VWRAGLLLALGLASGCAARRETRAIESLPDGEDIARTAAAELLEAATGDPDASLRAIAIAAYVSSTDTSDCLRWLEQGLHDPDGAVQRAVVNAAGQRREPELVAALRAYLGRRSADAGSRLALAEARPELLGDALHGVWRDVVGWRRPPVLALSALSGDAEAKPLWLAALREGAAGDDPAMLAAVLRAFGPEAFTVLAEAGERYEEELGAPYALARVVGGDASARAAWRAFVRSKDVDVALDAVDLLVGWSSSRRALALEVARPAGGVAARVAELLDGAPVAAWRAALGGDDVDLRTTAADRLAAGEGPVDKLVDVLAARSLEEPVEAIRADLALALARAPVTPATDEALWTAMVDRYPSVRVAAAAAWRLRGGR